MESNVSSINNEKQFSEGKLKKLKALRNNKNRNPQDEILMMKLGREMIDYLTYQAVANNVHLFGEKFKCTHVRQLDLLSKKDEALVDAFTSKILQHKDLSSHEEKLFTYLDRIFMYRLCSLAKVNFLQFEALYSNDEKEEEENSDSDNSLDGEDSDNEDNDDDGDGEGNEFCISPISRAFPLITNFFISGADRYIYESEEETLDLGTRLSGIYLSNGTVLHVRAGGSKSGSGYNRTSTVCN